MELNDVEGKRVLVTGAAMGMGKLFATRAVEEGAAAVVLWDVNKAALEETAEELTAAGGTVNSYVVDVADPGSIADTAERVRESLGGVDVLINNAGIVRGNTYFWETENLGDIAATMNINALALMYITREFLPGMVEGGGEARVVNIASSAGLLANPRMAVYAGSKWAALGWSESLRLELEQAGADHVKVTTVCPGFVDTGMFDGVKSPLLTPVLKPIDVVEASWSAMRKGEALVVIPAMAKVNRKIGNLLPLKVRDKLYSALGVYESMEAFRGR